MPSLEGVQQAGNELPPGSMNAPECVCDEKTDRVEVLFPHVSILEKNKDVPLKECSGPTGCKCGKVHCPLCQPGTYTMPTIEEMRIHLKHFHMTDAVHLEEATLLLCLCQASCTKHYHCPLRGCILFEVPSVAISNHISEHLIKCKNKRKSTRKPVPKDQPQQVQMTKSPLLAHPHPSIQMQGISLKYTLVVEPGRGPVAMCGVCDNMLVRRGNYYAHRWNMHEKHSVKWKGLQINACYLRSCCLEIDFVPIISPCRLNSPTRRLLRHHHCPICGDIFMFGKDPLQLHLEKCPRRPPGDIVPYEAPGALPGQSAADNVGELPSQNQVEQGTESAQPPSNLSPTNKSGKQKSVRVPKRKQCLASELQPSPMRSPMSTSTPKQKSTLIVNGKSTTTVVSTVRTTSTPTQTPTRTAKKKSTPPSVEKANAIVNENIVPIPKGKLTNTPKAKPAITTQKTPTTTPKKRKNATTPKKKTPTTTPKKKTPTTTPKKKTPTTTPKKSTSAKRRSLPIGSLEEESIFADENLTLPHETQDSSFLGEKEELAFSNVKKNTPKTKSTFGAKSKVSPARNGKFTSPEPADPIFKKVTTYAARKKTSSLSAKNCDDSPRAKKVGPAKAKPAEKREKENICIPIELPALASKKKKRNCSEGKLDRKENRHVAAKSNLDLPELEQSSMPSSSLNQQKPTDNHGELCSPKTKRRKRSFSSSQSAAKKRMKTENTSAWKFQETDDEVYSSVTVTLSTTALRRYHAEPQLLLTKVATKANTTWWKDGNLKTFLMKGSWEDMQDARRLIINGGEEDLVEELVAEDPWFDNMTEETKRQPSFSAVCDSENLATGKTIPWKQPKGDINCSVHNSMKSHNLGKNNVKTFVKWDTSVDEPDTEMNSIVHEISSQSSDSARYEIQSPKTLPDNEEGSVVYEISSQLPEFNRESETNSQSEILKVIDETECEPTPSTGHEVSLLSVDLEEEMASHSFDDCLQEEVHSKDMEMGANDVDMAKDTSCAQTPENNDTKAEGVSCSPTGGNQAESVTSRETEATQKPGYTSDIYFDKHVPTPNNSIFMDDASSKTETTMVATTFPVEDSDNTICNVLFDDNCTFIISSSLGDSTDQSNLNCAGPDMNNQELCINDQSNSKVGSTYCPTYNDLMADCGFSKQDMIDMNRNHTTEVLVPTNDQIISKTRTESHSTELHQTTKYPPPLDQKASSETYTTLTKHTETMDDMESSLCNDTSIAALCKKRDNILDEIAMEMMGRCTKSSDHDQIVEGVAAEMGDSEGYPEDTNNPSNAEASKSTQVIEDHPPVDLCLPSETYPMVKNRAMVELGSQLHNDTSVNSPDLSITALCEKQDKILEEIAIEMGETCTRSAPFITVVCGTPDQIVKESIVEMEESREYQQALRNDNASYRETSGINYLQPQDVEFQFDASRKNSKDAKIGDDASSIIFEPNLFNETYKLPHLNGELVCENGTYRAPMENIDTGISIEIDNNNNSKEEATRDSCADNGVNEDLTDQVMEFVGEIEVHTQSKDFRSTNQRLENTNLTKPQSDIATRPDKILSEVPSNVSMCPNDETNEDEFCLGNKDAKPKAVDDTEVCAQTETYVTMTPQYETTAAIMRRTKSNATFNDSVASSKCCFSTEAVSLQPGTQVTYTTGSSTKTQNVMEDNVCSVAIICDEANKGEVDAMTQSTDSNVMVCTGDQILRQTQSIYEDEHCQEESAVGTAKHCLPVSVRSDGESGVFMQDDRAESLVSVDEIVGLYYQHEYANDVPVNTKDLSLKIGAIKRTGSSGGNQGYGTPHTNTMSIVQQTSLQPACGNTKRFNTTQTTSVETTRHEAIPNTPQNNTLVHGKNIQESYIQTFNSEDRAHENDQYLADVNPFSGPFQGNENITCPSCSQDFSFLEMIQHMLASKVCVEKCAFCHMPHPLKIILDAVEQVPGRNCPLCGYEGVSVPAAIFHYVNCTSSAYKKSSNNLDPEDVSPVYEEHTEKETCLGRAEVDDDPPRTYGHTDAQSQLFKCHWCTSEFSLETNYQQHLKYHKEVTDVELNKCLTLNNINMSDEYYDRKKDDDQIIEYSTINKMDIDTVPSDHTSTHRSNNVPVDLELKHQILKPACKEVEMSRRLAKASCEVCGLEVRKRNLKNHVKKKHPIAEWSSNKRNGHNRILSSQNKDSNGDFQPLQIFGCPFCGRKFHKPVLLREHAQFAHKKEKVFVCNKCGKAYRRYDGLEFHKLNACAETVQFICVSCEKKFPSRTTLKNHMKRVHSYTRMANVEPDDCSSSNVPDSADGDKVMSPGQVILPSSLPENIPPVQSKKVEKLTRSNSKITTGTPVSHPGDSTTRYVSEPRLPFVSQNNEDHLAAEILQSLLDDEYPLDLRS